MVGLSVDIVNQLVGNSLGPIIQEKILEFNSTITINDTETIRGITVEANLSDIKLDRLDIHWT
jgi:hypothetical protein